MRQRTVNWIIEPIKTLCGTIYDFDHKDVDFRKVRGRGVSQARKRMTREGERCERVAWPKLFGAAGRESARAMRSAKVVDPPPRFGSGGTGDLDTNRGPPIPTPNAKKPARVHACVCVRRELSLSRVFSLRYKKRWPSIPFGRSSRTSFSRFSSRPMKEMKILIVRSMVESIYDQSSFHYDGDDAKYWLRLSLFRYTQWIVLSW